MSKISEHALVQVGSSERTIKNKKVKVDELLKVISQKPSLVTLQTAVKQANKRAQTLRAPLEKPQALRVGYLAFNVHTLHHSLLSTFLD